MHWMSIWNIKRKIQNANGASGIHLKKFRAL